MNNLEKKIIDLYIKTNKTDKFVKTKPSNQEILYFAKHSSKNNLTDLTRYVLDSNNLDLIVDYAMYAKTISIKDIEKIVDHIFFCNSAEHICRLARYVKFLEEVHINLLTRAIIQTKNYAQILRFYVEVEKLSETNKESIYIAILKSKNNKAMTDFIIRLPELTDDKIGKLIDALDINDISEYKRILTKLTYGNKYKLLLKVLNTNNINFIFEFIGNCKELVEKNEDIIFDKLVKIGNTRAIVEYYCDIVKNYNILYENKIVALLKETNDCESIIYLLSKYTLLNAENIATLEKMVLNSNDKLLIAKYILLTNNNVLAVDIFNNLMYFYIFCKDILKMDIKLEEFKVSLGINVDDEYINYIDDNIEKYNKGVAPLK